MLVSANRPGQGPSQLEAEVVATARQRLPKARVSAGLSFERPGVLEHLQRSRRIDVLRGRGGGRGYVPDRANCGHLRMEASRWDSETEAGEIGKMIGESSGPAANLQWPSASANEKHSLTEVTWHLRPQKMILMLLTPW